MPAPAEYEVSQQHTISLQQTDQNSVELITFFKCQPQLPQLPSSDQHISVLPEEVNQHQLGGRADLGDHSDSQCSAVCTETNFLIKI